MKFMAILATLAFSAIAQATPAVGDYAKHSVTLSNGSQSIAGTYEIALVGKNGNAFQMSVTTTFPGQPADYKQEDVAADQLISDAQISAVLSACAQNGGRAETVKVAAGTYNTCALQTEDGGTVWLGSVPFGVVKQTGKTPEGYVVDLELQMFVNGK